MYKQFEDNIFLYIKATYEFCASRKYCSKLAPKDYFSMPGLREQRYVEETTN